MYPSQGRLFSCVLDEDLFWITALRYVELNPVRAVSRPTRDPGLRLPLAPPPTRGDAALGSTMSSSPNWNSATESNSAPNNSAPQTTGPPASWIYHDARRPRPLSIRSTSIAKPKSPTWMRAAPTTPGSCSHTPPTGQRHIVMARSRPQLRGAIPLAPPFKLT